jgi:glycosyltransferase 2 family protein
VSWSRSRVLRTALGLAAAVAVAVAFVSTLDDAEAVGFPSAWRLAVAVAATLVALVVAGAAWWRLLGSVTFVRLLPGFLTAQLARYLPGSVWQGVSQVLDAERLGVRRSRASTAFLLQLGTQAVAATVVGLLALLAGPQLPGWFLAIVVLAPICAVPTLHRAWMQRLSGWAARRSRRFAGMDLTLPAQREILLATALGVVNLVLVGVAFGLLLAPATSLRAIAVAAGVFALAWVAGFLVVPLPAGLGVREAVLVAGLAHAYPAAVLLGAAVVLRLLMIAGEAGLALLARSWSAADRRR